MSLLGMNPTYSNFLQIKDDYTVQCFGVLIYKINEI